MFAIFDGFHNSNCSQWGDEKLCLSQSKNYSIQKVFHLDGIVCAFVVESHHVLQELMN